MTTSTATSPTHYGHEVWQDEDGETYYLAGHVPLRRAVAAANRYARIECGLVNLYDDPDPSPGLPGARHVWWKPAEEDPYGEGWMEPASADESGAEPFTEVYLATHHDLACTGSNEPGQPGSAYEQVVAPPASAEELRARILDQPAPAPQGEEGREDTCCGRCPGSSCYVDQVTGA